MSPLYKRMTEGLQKTLQGRRKQLSALAKPLPNLMMKRLSHIHYLHIFKLNIWKHKRRKVGVY
jgi:hypothetical protein